MSATCTFEELSLLIELDDEQAALDAGGYFFRLLGSDSGTAFADAEATVTQVESQLFAGATAEVSSYANMTVTLALQIVGADSAQLAAGAAALTAVCRRPGIRELTWTAADGASEPTVFDVLVATKELTFDDMAEDYQNRRTYTLTLVCKPFPRSATKVTVPALQVPTTAPTTSALTIANATSGWSTAARTVTQTNLSTNGSVERSISGRQTTLKNTKTTTGQYTYTNGNGGGGVLLGGKTFTASSQGQLTRQNDFDAASGNWYAQAQPNPAAWPVAPHTFTEGGNTYTLTSSSQGASTWTGNLYITEKYVVEANTQYTFSIYVRKPGVARAIQMGRGWGDGTTVDNVASIASIGNGDGWQRLTYTFNSGSHTGVWFYFHGSGTTQYDAGENWWFDADMLNPGSSAADYFDGASTNGKWTGAAYASTSVLLADAAVSLVSSRVTVTGWSGLLLSLTYTGTIDTSTQPFIAVDVKTNAYPGVPTTGTGLDWTLKTSDGRTLTPTYKEAVPGSTAHSGRIWFRTSATSLTGFTLIGTKTTAVTGTPTIQLSITGVSTNSSLPLLGTGRQAEQTVAAYGTMPAEASLTLDNGGTALGAHTILYTTSGDYLSPPLRQYRTAGPLITAASGSISGATETLATTQASATTYQLDGNAMPRASYLLMAHLTGASLTAGTSYTVSWRATTRAQVAVTGSTVITATGTTQAAALYELGLIALPTWDVTATGTASAVVQVQIWVSDGTWTLDEAWLFDVDNGDLTVITTTAAVVGLTSIEVIPASVEHPVEKYVGILDSGGGNVATLDLSQWVTSWTQHRFDPVLGDGSVYAYLMNDATSPALGLNAEFFPRWDMYAATINLTATADAA